MADHIPVLLDELIALLQPKSNEHYLDATFGGGGMATSVLGKVSPKGTVTGIEQDVNVLKAHNKQRGLRIIHGNFADIDTLIDRSTTFDGIYFDLGISTDQLNDTQRGISFAEEHAPLDMRMSQTEDNFTAAQLLNSASREDLVNVFSAYGHEARSKTFAREIVKIRKEKRFMTVGDLLKVVRTVYPHTYYKKHPGTKIWQALRIAVNDELASIETALPLAFERLQPGGRMAVISFHSLEDRIVKKYFKKIAKEGSATLINKKVITPTEEETKRNPRSRSAKLRGIQKEQRQK